MEYYSNVTIQCGKEAFRRIKDLYMKYKFNPQRIYECKDDSSFIIQWFGVEWYDCFEEVSAIDNALSELNDEKFNHEDYAYKFIRTGEDFEDVELRSNQQGDGDYYSLVPTIEVSLPTNARIIESLYTWDDLYERAIECDCNSNELRAKDEARWQLTKLIREECGYDIDERECPEEEIEIFIWKRQRSVLFDDCGNIRRK